MMRPLMLEGVNKLLPWMKRVGEPKASIIIGAVWFGLIIVIAILVILFVPKAWYGPFGAVSFIVIVLAVIVGAAAQRRSRSREVPVDLPEPMGREVDRLLAEGDRVAAINYVREQTGLRPKVALRAVNHRTAATTDTD